ncbi:39S ribosomal protein L32, mitochondrial [Thalassophryne amazonica]|uniref:39S ribosomal protein L32, mitochondrial n=1 Tax=Thalassophryne amazonica TaxID=390379 RepID=UPI001471027F|nr:39S ribosomal protein L32, mitochondrial [Thalassophryne amazonica]
MANLVVLVQGVRCWLLRTQRRILQAAALEPHPVPSLAVNGPGLQPQIHPQHQEEQESPEHPPGILDGFMWMAAPKSRRSIEVNRTRRRSESKLIKVKTNIEVCPQCGHLKQKHILCSFCYEKVRIETGLIRKKIAEMEGGPLRAPTVETVIMYEGETPSEKDKDKRIVERPRKRPIWFH